MAAIAEAVEKERREKQKANAVNQHQEALGKKLPQPSAIKDEQKTAHKAAELFKARTSFASRFTVSADTPVCLATVSAVDFKVSD
jgi:hypothetical protein